MSSLKYPSFNFAYCPTEDPRLFFIDYGRTGLVHVFRSGENIECIPQKKEIDENTMVRFLSKKPTLPLNLPDESTGHINNLESLTKFGNQTHCEQQVTNLISDRGAVVFGAIADEVSTQAAALSWSPASLNLRNSVKFDPVTERMQSDFCDVPLGLLSDLIQESNEEEKTTATGKYYGNCLAHARSTLASESDVVLVYPGGSSMNELHFSHLEIDHEKEIGLSARKGSFCLPERICQVTMGDEQDVIAVRTDHRCWLFASEDYEEPRFLGNLECKTKPCDIIASPYISEEFIVAMETGSLWLWNAEDSSVEVLRQCSSSAPGEFNWNFTEFASNPRQVIRGNQSNVELVDLRGSSSTSQDLMTLPSPHFFPDDYFTAVQRYHKNPFHYILGTTQVLAVMDMRFQQNPVLKWCHSLENPIKYINALPDPTSEDVLVFVGSYNSHEVHCFQYCYGEIWNAPLTLVDESTSVLPPRSSSKPWKISSYHEWPEMVSYPNKAQSHRKVSERLSQPLHGLSCITDSTRKSLTVIQLSNTGELFYQHLSPHRGKLQKEGRLQYYEYLEASGGCSSKQLKLEENEHKFITKWVNCLMERVYSESKDMQEELDENCDSEDVGILREELFSSMARVNTQCSLCSDRGFSDSREPGDVCPYCKMSRELSDKFGKVRKAESPKPVLTKKSLGLKYKAPVLQMFNVDMQCSEPLGAALLRNWHSDEPVPVDLTGQQSNESKDNKQEMVKTWLEQGETSQIKTDDTSQPTGNTSNNMSPVGKIGENVAAKKDMG